MLHKPGIWKGLHLNRAMVEKYYQLAQFSMNHQNFFGTHPRPEKLKGINLLIPEVYTDLHVTKDLTTENANLV